MRRSPTTRFLAFLPILCAIGCPSSSSSVDRSARPLVVVGIGYSADVPPVPFVRFTDGAHVFLSDTSKRFPSGAKVSEARTKAAEDWIASER